MNLQNLTYSELYKIVNIGFCQPSFYKPSIWAKAKKVMDYLVSLNIGVVPFDFGRGKGKYTSDESIEKIVDKVAAKFEILKPFSYGEYTITYENKKCVVYWGLIDVWENDKDNKETAIQKAKNWIDANPEYNG